MVVDCVAADPGGDELVDLLVLLQPLRLVGVEFGLLAKVIDLGVTALCGVVGSAGLEDAGRRTHPVFRVGVVLAPSARRSQLKVVAIQSLGASGRVRRLDLRVKTKNSLEAVL